MLTNTFFLYLNPSKNMQLEAGVGALIHRFRYACRCQDPLGQNLFR